MTKRLAAVLFHLDTEMDEISTILSRSDVPYTFATVDGQQVNSCNAYRAEGVMDRTVIDNADYIMLVEGKFTDEARVIPSGKKILYIDHHHEWDFGYKYSYKRFMDGSSIGQVISKLAQYNKHLNHFHLATPNLLEYSHWIRGKFILYDGKWCVWARNGAGEGYILRKIPQRLVNIAAVDHCPKAAWDDKCPGVVF